MKTFRCGRPRTEEYGHYEWSQGKQVLKCSHCRKLQATRAILQHWDEWESDFTGRTREEFEQSLRELEASFTESAARRDHPEG